MKLEEIGKFIAYLRKEKNLTQAELEKIIGIDRKTISKWENGQVAPDITILNSLATALDVSTYELLSGKRLKIVPQKGDVTTESIKYYSKITKKKIYIFSTILFIVLIMLFGVFEYASNYYEYNIKQITSKTENFQIDGRLIYNKKETILFINNILFADNLIGTDKEIKASSITVSLLEKDNTILIKNITSAVDNKEEYINSLLENLTLEYFDDHEKIKIKNFKDLTVNVEYSNSKGSAQNITINLDFE